MATSDQHDSDSRPTKRQRLSPPEANAYVLRNVLEDIPLAADDGQAQVSVTCAEYWSEWENGCCMLCSLTADQTTTCTLGLLRRKSSTSFLSLLKQKTTMHPLPLSSLRVCNPVAMPRPQIPRMLPAVSSAFCCSQGP
jgi:hypothetical protein